METAKAARYIDPYLYIYVYIRDRCADIGECGQRADDLDYN